MCHLYVKNQRQAHRKHQRQRKSRQCQWMCLLMQHRNWQNYQMNCRLRLPNSILVNQEDTMAEKQSQDAKAKSGDELQLVVFNIGTAKAISTRMQIIPQ